MSSSWEAWSMHVLKSIERIESAIKTIDDTIDTIVEKFNEKLLKLEQRINTRISELEKEERKNELNIAIQRVKLAFIIAGISAAVSLIVTQLAKYVDLSKIF